MVDLLKVAAQLEHCLLDAYLYAASSLKSTPQEFATLPDGRPNRRRAIQFERVRSWKQTILEVTHEEMLHLHYVQCLLRALGEPPAFDLPRRAPDGTGWLFPGWQAQVGGELVDGGEGVEVEVAAATSDTLGRFVLYEATDALQDADPFGPAVRALFDRLYDLEGRLRIAESLYEVTDPAENERLRTWLTDLYATLSPVEEAAPITDMAAAPEAAAGAYPRVEDVRFQSIADLYYQAILPLYQEAFEEGWAVHSNRDLNNELLNPQYAAEGFLPIGPTYRDKNFEAYAAGNTDDPLLHYRDVRDIITEIVEEGEGFSDFAGSAQALLDKVAELGSTSDLGGPHAYLAALQDDKSSDTPTPPWLADGQLLRESHLYRFVTIMRDYDRERDIAGQAGTTFDPVRRQITVDGHTGLQKLTDELPAQFNACYLVLVAWLSRMYEIPDWIGDRPRRRAIEMVASWPLMSLAIRPMLELASFFPVNLRGMFRLDRDALPPLPLHARQLADLWEGEERSEEINERMDRLAVRALADVAAWAGRKKTVVASLDLDANTSAMVQGRLEELSHLDEFQRQFPFRVAGGYSSRMPDRTYQQEHPDAQRYAENPTSLAVPVSRGPDALFEDTLVVRLRFAGWGLVQLATDPDPPWDEVGCTGTLMLHPADGDRRFDRALVWRLTDPGGTILRGPREHLPPLGVPCVEASLLVTGDGGATAGYVPIGTMSSTGAVQASGVQQVLQIDGLHPLLSVAGGALLSGDEQVWVDLLTKDGVRPFLNGLNHLVFQDGEPIDPFVLALVAGPDGGPWQPLVQREVFNDGRSLMDMSPLERLYSARWPVGFDSVANLPPWAASVLPEAARADLGTPTFAPAYLKRRAQVLTEALGAWVGEDKPDQQGADTIVSLVERLRLVSVPRGTTVGWLPALLHYGHTVSGDLAVGDAAGRLLTALGGHTGLDLGLVTGVARDRPNGRWLASYTKGVMDTDAITDLVYGELYLPVTVGGGTDPVVISREWTAPAAMSDALAGYACRFDRPFWADFEVSGDERTLVLPDGTTITERLAEQSGTSYRYTLTGLDHIDDYQGAFAVEPQGDSAVLRWDARFTSSDAAATVRALSLIAGAAATMTQRMAAHFAPDGHDAGLAADV